MSSKLFQTLCPLLLFLVAGCKNAGPLVSRESNEISETILSPSTPTHPRQTEADIVVLKGGTLLAAWSDFTGGRRDEATAQISAAKSTDGGRTWTAPFVLQENIGKHNVMSVSFLRERSGEILFFFLVKNSLSDLKVFVRRSSDEAKTWSAPVVVTPEPGYSIMNNARVIQLNSGGGARTARPRVHDGKPTRGQAARAPGRILCPISFCDDIGKRSAHLRTLIYFSDDGGRSWKHSKDYVDVPKRGAMEPHVIELKDGKVLQIIRTELGQIWFSTSADGGDTWSSAAPFGVVSPESPSTIKRMPDTGELLLIYNPSIERGITKIQARTPLVASLSKDEGKTWSAPKVIEASLDFSYAYTSVTFCGDRALLTYWQGPQGTLDLSLKFKSIPLDWFRH